LPVLSSLYRIAEMGDKSGALWATVTVVICIGCAAIPLPFFNLVSGIVLSYVAMFVSTMIAQR
jgi:hypothetical protein